MLGKSSVAVVSTLIITMVLVFYTTARAQFVTEGLISFWTFDKSTVKGDVVEDVWGENDGTMQGGPKTAEGKINEAIELDGADDFVSIDAPKSIPKGNDTYAIEAWFFADVASGAKGIMGWGSWGAGNQVNALRLKDHGFRHYWWGNDLDWATNSITGEWHHVIAQFDGKTRSLWFDGKMITSDQPAGHNAQIADVNIGVTNNRGEFFDGKIDELRLYSRGLSEDEVRKNFEAKSNTMAIDSAGKLSTLWGQIKAGQQ